MKIGGLTGISAALALMAGCSYHKTVIELPSASPSATVANSADNSLALDNKITETLQTAGHTVADVQCPADVSTSKGAATDCTATVDGQSVTLHVAFVADNHFVVSEQ